MAPATSSASGPDRSNEFQVIGVIGLGLMGSAISQRLISCGFDLIGFDIDPEKTEHFVRLGGRVVENASAVAQEADCVILAVFDTQQVENVIDSEILPGLGPASKTIVLSTTTSDPDRIEALAVRAASLGLTFLDTPISGTSEKVSKGEALVLVGGDPAAAERISHILDALSPDRIHVGTAGDATRAKLVINLVSGLNRVVLSEGLVFAEALGLDPKRSLEILKRGASYSRAMDTKGPKMVTGDFRPFGRARQHLKDVQLILQQAESSGLTLSLSTFHAEVLWDCVNAGEGDLDNSVVINEIRRRAVGRRIGR